MALAIFDLDNTLLVGDSEEMWWSYVAAQGLVPAQAFDQARSAILAAAQHQPIDVMAYASVTLESFTKCDRPTLDAHLDAYLEACIVPCIPDRSRELLDKHRAAGDTILIITATNRYLTAPIADRLGVSHLIATEVEEVDGEFTGKLQGTPSFREGKIKRLYEWLKEFPHDLEGSYFYSDSHHDLPLLKTVTNPIAVNPDQALKLAAQTAGWEIIYTT